MFISDKFMKWLHETNDEQIYNREELNSAFISNMCSFIAVLINSCKVTSLLGQDSVSSSLFLRAKLHKLHISIYLMHIICALMAVMLNKVY